MGNSDTRRNYLESFKVCSALPEKQFCIRRPNQAISSVEPIFRGSEDSLQAFERLQNKFIGNSNIWRNGSSRPDVSLGKGVLKLYSKFTGEHSCQSAISINLQSNFTEIALRQECFPVNLLYIFRTPFPKNTSGWLLMGKSFRRVSQFAWLSQKNRFVFVGQIFHF